MLLSAWGSSSAMRRDRLFLPAIVAPRDEPAELQPEEDRPALGKTVVTVLARFPQDAVRARLRAELARLRIDRRVVVEKVVHDRRTVVDPPRRNQPRQRTRDRGVIGFEPGRDFDAPAVDGRVDERPQQLRVTAVLLVF